MKIVRLSCLAESRHRVRRFFKLTNKELFKDGIAM